MLAAFHCPVPRGFIRRTGLALLLALTPGLPTLRATSIPQKSLSELVAASDHILVGTVVDMGIYNSAGWKLSNPWARTGPGLSNQIWRRVKIDRQNVLKTDRAELPDFISIGEWQMWHSRHNNWMEDRSVGQSYIFLLTGEEMRWVYPRDFQRDLEDKAQIEQLIRKPPSSAAPLVLRPLALSGAGRDWGTIVAGGLAGLCLLAGGAMWAHGRLGWIYGHEVGALGLLVVLARLVFGWFGGEFGSVVCRVAQAVLSPGCVAVYFLSGEGHAGFGDVRDDLLMAGVSWVSWLFLFWCWRQKVRGRPS
jgi:hypothetical protein